MIVIFSASAGVVLAEQEDLRKLYEEVTAPPGTVMMPSLKERLLGLDAVSKKQMVLYLIEPLRMNDRTVMLSKAAQALGLIGMESEQVVPVLLDVLKRDYGNSYANSQIHELAIVAILRLDPSNQEARVSFVEGVSDGRISITNDRNVVELGKSIVPLLVEILKKEDVDGFKKADAITILGAIGPQAAEAVPVLMDQLLKNPDMLHVKAEGGDPAQNTGTYNGSAAGALANIGPSALPPLIHALKDDNPCLRYAASVALGDMGPEARPAVPSLIKILEKDSDDAVRFQVSRTLGDIGSADAIPALQKLRDKLYRKDLLNSGFGFLHVWGDTPVYKWIDKDIEKIRKGVSRKKSADYYKLKQLT